MPTNKGKAKNPNDPERIKKLDEMMFGKHWQITLRVIFVTLGTIAIFGSIGYLIDQQLESAPIATISAVVISYPAAQFIIYKVFNKITQ